MSALPNDPLPHGVIIGAREIYDAVVRLTGRVDMLVLQQSQAQAEIVDHETRLRHVETSVVNVPSYAERIRALESSRWPLPTASVMISLAALAILIVEKFIN